MEKFPKASIKYEVVIGLITDNYNRYNPDTMKTKWQEYAKEYFDMTGVYVSAIAIEGNAIYNKDWGCPTSGEPCITFNCTINPHFITDFEVYEAGIIYITKKLKKEFHQHTITITKIPSGVFYLTDTDNI